MLTELRLFSEYRVSKILQTQIRLYVWSTRLKYIGFQNSHIRCCWTEKWSFSFTLAQNISSLPLPVANANGVKALFRVQNIKNLTNSNPSGWMDGWMCVTNSDVSFDSDGLKNGHFHSHLHKISLHCRYLLRMLTELRLFSEYRISKILQTQIRLDGWMDGCV